MSTVLRWRLVDTETDESWTMPLNPFGMTAPPIVKSLSFAPKAQRYSSMVNLAGFRTPEPAQAWSWTGIIRSKSHHDSLAEWAARDHLIEVHDHLGRTFEVAMQSFTATEKRSRTLKWRLEYTMETLVLRRTA